MNSLISVVVKTEFRETSGWGMMEPFTRELWIAIMGVWFLCCVTIGFIQALRSTADFKNLPREVLQAALTSSLSQPICHVAFHAEGFHWVSPTQATVRSFYHGTAALFDGDCNEWIGCGVVWPLAQIILMPIWHQVASKSGASGNTCLHARLAHILHSESDSLPYQA